MLGDLLTRLKTDLIDLEILLFNQIRKPSILFLENFLFLEINDNHKNLLLPFYSEPGEIEKRFLIQTFSKTDEI